MNEMITSTKKRIVEIDILKGIAIICMVSGHAGAPFKWFISLFHMSVFIIASGYFYKEKSSNSTNSVIRSIVSKIKQLWFPYFLWNGIFTLLNNWFIDINIYTNNQSIYNYLNGENIGIQQYMTLGEMAKNILKGLWFGGGTIEGGALWFLRTLCMISFGYIIIDFLIKKFFNNHILFIQLIASSILLIFGYLCSLNNVGLKGLAAASSCYSLYYLGLLLNKFRSKYDKLTWKQYLIALVLSCVGLITVHSFGRISLGTNDYVNPLFLLSTSILGWCFLYSLSFFIKQSYFRNVFTVIGKNTLSIMILHLIFMKMIAYIVCIYYNLPLFCAAAHPNVYGNRGLWWLVYTMVGTLVPVCLSIMYKKIKKMLKENEFLWKV